MQFQTHLDVPRYLAIVRASNLYAFPPGFDGRKVTEIAPIQLAARYTEGPSSAKKFMDTYLDWKHFLGKLLVNHGPGTVLHSMTKYDGTPLLIHAPHAQSMPQALDSILVQVVGPLSKRE